MDSNYLPPLPIPEHLALEKAMRDASTELENADEELEKAIAIAFPVDHPLVQAKSAAYVKHRKAFEALYQWRRDNPTWNHPRMAPPKPLPWVKE